MLFFVLLFQGCDDSKVKPPVEEGPQKEIVLIEESLGEIEGFLGSSLRIENGDLEVRSYSHKGFNIQVSYAEGESVAVEFSKVEQGKLGALDELDWDLILRLCGAKAGEMEGLVSYAVTIRIDKAVISLRDDFLISCFGWAAITLRDDHVIKRLAG